MEVAHHNNIMWSLRAYSTTSLVHLNQSTKCCKQIAVTLIVAHFGHSIVAQISSRYVHVFGILSKACWRNIELCMYWSHTCKYVTGTHHCSVYWIFAPLNSNWAMTFYNCTIVVDLVLFTVWWSMIEAITRPSYLFTLLLGYSVGCVDISMYFVK